MADNLVGKLNPKPQMNGSLNQPITPWTNDHSELTHLDYASSGHTGFTSATDFFAFASGLPESAKSGKYTDLIEKPKINGVELVGNKTSSELKIIGDKTFVYLQQTASKTWDITHNLDKFCSVTVVDSSGTVVVGDISYKSTNRVVIDFGGSFSGEAYLN